MGLSARNIEVIKNGANNFLATEVKPKLREILALVATNIVSFVEREFTLPLGSEQYPVCSANMRDSTGVGVYMDGRLTHYMPTKVASNLQHFGAIENIDGHKELKAAIERAATDYSEGIWIVLFSAVPYAYKINTVGSPWGRGVNYFTSLVEDFTSKIKDQLRKNFRNSKLE